jgi:hypothetical protein
VCEVELKDHTVNSGCNLTVTTMYSCLLWNKALTLTVRSVSRISVRSLKRRDIDSSKLLVSDTGKGKGHPQQAVEMAQKARVG